MVYAGEVHVGQVDGDVGARGVAGVPGAGGGAPAAGQRALARQARHHGRRRTRHPRRGGERRQPSTGLFYLMLYTSYK